MKGREAHGRYRLVVADTAHGLETECSALIEEGWVPVGAPSVESWDSGPAIGTDYRQAM